MASMAPGETVGYMQTTPEAVQAAKRFHGQDSTTGDVMLRRSPDSYAMLDYWDQTDTIIDGIKAMRNAADTYLPRFTDEQPTDYSFRLKLTKMTNVYRDAVEGLAAKPFEQEVTLVEDENKTVPEPIKTFTEDVDGSGNNLTVFAAATFFNGINSAIDWIFIDSPPIDPNAIRSIADAKAAGIRPYWSHVLGRNVLEPRSKVINGKEVLTYIRIFEPGKINHVRVFERTETGLVIWTLYEWRKEERDLDGGKTHYFEISSGTVDIGVIPLVPFITGRRDGRTFKLFPAMQDAADLQIELYQQESGLKFAKNLTAYPMLSGNGVSPPKNADGTIQKLAVGPGRVLYAPPSNAGGQGGEWVYVEPNSQSLKFLADDIDATIKQLRELGRQPLTAQSGNLTVITTAVAASKSKSAVKGWALGLKDALENAFVITALFMGIKTGEYDPTVSVYVDFDEFIEGKDIEALAAARATKDISRETYHAELKRRRVLSDEFDHDDEKERLAQEALDETPSDDDGLDNNQ
jgi:hypothetical protein